MPLRSIRLYALFTVALCALQAIGLQIAGLWQIEFGWSTMVLANFCAAQTVLWSFIRQTGRAMSQTEKLLFAGYATALTTALAIVLYWIAQSAATSGSGAGLASGLVAAFTALDPYELGLGFGIGVAAVIMGLSFGTRTYLRLHTRFGADHSAGAAKRV